MPNFPYWEMRHLAVSHISYNKSNKITSDVQVSKHDYFLLLTYANSNYSVFVDFIFNMSAKFVWHRVWISKDHVGH